MKKVWCVVGQENVWANVQEFEAPSLIEFDFDNKKLWEPFLTPSIHKAFIGEGTLVQSVGNKVPNAPDVIHFRQKNKTEIEQLESNVKKFLAGKFEDERIKSVKKTTNWNLQLGGKLTEVLGAEPELVDGYQGAVEDYMNPKNQRKTRDSERRKQESTYRAGKEFNPAVIPFEKYRIYQDLDKILIDFV